MIDVKGLLNELGVDYKEDGKNVGSNDVNIDCPFCGWEKHLGISLKSGAVNCWVCSFEDLEKRPSLAKALMKTVNLRWQKMKSKMEDWGWEDSYIAKAATEDGLATKAKLPKESCAFDVDSSACRKAFRYLEKRNFKDDIIGRYDLRFTVDGYYHNRIIIPIYLNEKLVSFTSRDFTEKQEDRYKHASLHMSSERIKNLLYNYDRVKGLDKVYILEGVSDVWRMGDDSIAIFRSALSPAQRNLILKLKLKSATIIYDPMATVRAYLAADDLTPFIQKIKVVRLDGIKDVADRTRDEIIDMENKTNFYIG